MSPRTHTSFAAEATHDTSEVSAGSFRDQAALRAEQSYDSHEPSESETKINEIHNMSRLHCLLYLCWPHILFGGKRPSIS